MLVPDNQQQQHFMSSHVISMYLATCGANGFMLGSDEKEIIYLVFGIIDLKNKEVSDQKKYLDIFTASSSSSGKRRMCSAFPSTYHILERKKFLKNMFLANCGTHEKKFGRKKKRLYFQYKRVREKEKKLGQLTHRLKNLFFIFFFFFISFFHVHC